jgi:exonuclease III
LNATPSDTQEGRLIANKDTVDGSWEKFTLHTQRVTSADPYGETVTLRSEANGFYVSTEIEDSGEHKGMLRARKDGPIGSWERFYLKSWGDGTYSLQSEVSGLYVSVRLNQTEENERGLLRGYATSVGSWEKFVFEDVSGDTGSPSPSAHPSTSIRVMSWNVCSNNSACTDIYKYPPALFNTRVLNRFREHSLNGMSPQVIMLQEFCEKYAKPLEIALENETAKGWDVRFAPIEYNVIGNAGKRAQKNCVRDLNNDDRGAYGVAIAVPDQNTWYRSLDLLPIDNYYSTKLNTEQRTVLCATIDTLAVYACTAHFTSHGEIEAGKGDPREVQSDTLRSIASDAAGLGYRPVFGGDLNATRSESAVASIYDAGYSEFDAANNSTNNNGAKIDYIFAPGSATWSYPHVDTDWWPSDHKAISGEVKLP